MPPDPPLSSQLSTIAPRLATARDEHETEAMRGLSSCRHNYGCWHVYGAGPCFDTKEQARAYRDSLDREGVTWRSQWR